MQVGSADYTRTDTGLLVPVAAKRQREVWTKDEWKLLNRLGKLLKSRQMSFSIHCTTDDCKDKPMAFTPRPDGTSALACQCKERIFGRV